MFKKFLLSVFFMQSFLLATRKPSAAQQRMEPLIAAIQRGDVEVVTDIIQRNPECVHWRDDLDNTALHYAAVFCAQHGVEQGAAFVYVLIAAGARPEARNDCGQRPTDWVEVGKNGTISLRPWVPTIAQKPELQCLTG